jgi:VWFA-related protein
MTQASLVLALATALAATSVTFDAQGGAASQGARTRDVYVSVLDGNGTAVPGLTAADFTVREDGAVREVLKAGPATEPLTISVLVDDSQAAQPAIQELRRGLTAFVEQMQGKAEIAIATFGERPTSIVDYTTSTEVLKRGVTKVFSRQGAGAYLLDAIVEVSRGLQRREATRPVIIALTVEGIEFSNVFHERVLEELRTSRATLHVLAIGSPAPLDTEELRQRSIVLAEGTEQTGGRRDQLLAESAIPEKLKQLGAELLNQYVVTYGRPEKLIPPEKIEVAVNRPGLTVRAPKVAPGR